MGIRNTLDIENSNKNHEQNVPINHLVYEMVNSDKHPSQQIYTKQRLRLNVKTHKL